LPERFGPWRTIATRFCRWTHSGLWERIIAELRRIADATGGIDWEVHMVDATHEDAGIDWAASVPVRRNPSLRPALIERTCRRRC
jgi:transposase